jgi:phosphocarrier protein
MVEKTAVVRNSAGIHVRPSGVIIEAIKNNPATISVESKGFQVDLDSVMALLSLGLSQGDEVRIRVEGPGEKETAEQLAELFERSFDFPPR